MLMSNNLEKLEQGNEKYRTQIFRDMANKVIVQPP